MRLAALDRKALNLGLVPGLTLADTRARIRDIVVADYDAPGDAALLEEIAEDSERWTPLLAIDAPHGLMLDITGCAHVFGGEAEMCRRILERLRRAGLTVAAAVAGTADAARALARYGDAGHGRIVPPSGDAHAVQSLPIAALGLPDETVHALSRAGLRTIGDLAIRPHRPLASRFGEGLLVCLRRVLGLEDVRITPRRPLSACIVERRFMEPISMMEDIERTLAGLAGEAIEHLERRGEGGRVFEASFFRSDGKVRRVTVQTGRPTRSSHAILRLYRERLEALDDPLDPGFGFDLVRLGVPVCEALDTPQTSLDGTVTGTDDVLDLVDRLVARFGKERVLRFAARNSHDPVRVAHRVAAIRPSQAALAEAWPDPEPGEPPLRPIQLFDPPQPVDTLAEVPDGPPIRFRWRRRVHTIARAEGPERIAAEWWRSGATRLTRDYYRVEDTEGRRFWIFRAGLYDRDEGPRWFLHGLFA